MSSFGVLDPVTVKEIFGISRRGQTYFGRVVYVGLIGLILYEFWNRIVSRTPVVSPSEVAQLGRLLFQQFVPLQLVMVSLAAVGAAADRVLREEKSGTLGLLLLTPLTARRVAFAKWKAAMVQAGSLILCGVPVVAVCVYLGSVGPWELLWCFSLTGATAMLGAAFGLRASAVCSSVPRAFGMGMLYVAGYALLPLVLLFVTGAAAFFAAPFLHPAYSMYTLTFAGVDADSFWVYCWIPSTIVSALVSAWIVSGVAPLIERRVAAPREVARPSPDETPSPPPGLRRVFGKKEVRLRETREVWESDPLLWKEIVTRGAGRWSPDVKSMFLIYALIFIALCWLFTQGGSLGTFAFLGANFAFLALVNGASLFAPEKEGRKIEMLLSSPVPSARIVRSKLLAGLLAPEAVRVLILALATAAAFGWWSGFGVFLYVGVLLIFLLFVFVLSAAASLHADTLQGAALASAGILCALLLVLPIFVSLAAPAEADGVPLPASLRLLKSLDPVWVLEPLQPSRGGDAARAASRFAWFAAVYGSAIAALAALMHGRFDRRMGRG
jgi:ABC-type transport system involved in multi-copper enzyme maturation permease subunit